MDQSQPSHEINPSPGLFVSADWFSAFILSTRSAGCFTLGHFILKGSSYYITMGLAKHYL